ncbi:tudor domain-containing protein 5-like isoform X2 [Lineus longissimus]|uniref:tudor domain-containing protein 5-like isoform X2 n=1 Tax=Lineus longissimus TaxID=88925 RepID=UPI00315DBF33
MPTQGKADLLSSTKKKVRALLLSAKNGLLLREFITDYKDLIGQPFPYREIGFPTVESCLQEMKDVVWIQHQRNGDVKLRGVADETTQHIAELVSKQKSKKSGGRSRVLPLKTKQALMTKQRLERQMQLAQPYVPPFIRTNISQLLKEHPDGISGSSFNAIYSRRFGTQIDYNRLRFNNVKELLQSIQDIVHIETIFSGGIRIFSVDMAPQSKQARPVEQQGKYVVPHLRGLQSSGQNNSLASQDYSKTAEHSSRLVEDKDHRPQTSSLAKRSSPSEREKSSHGHRHHREKPVYADGIPADVKTKLQAVLKRRKAGMFSSRLQREFKDLHNEELPFQKFGFTSIIEFVSALPDIVAIERPNPKGDWVLYDSETSSRSSQSINTQPVPKKDSQPKANTELEKRLVKLLNTYPNGLLSAMLPEVYKQAYGEALSPEWYRFKSIDAMIRSLADRVLKLSYQGHGDVYIFPLSSNKSAGVPDPAPSQPNPQQEVPRPLPPVQASSSHHGHIPPDAVLSGSTFIKQRIPKDPEYLEVYVSNVTHPGKIWVQLKGVSTTDSLEELMDALEEVYCGNEFELYKMPEDYIMVGMPCAVVFPEDQNWHRCTITSAPENQQIVDVYFEDYGNTCSVHRNAVHFLKSKFMKLPAQAIEARLANITMANGKFWTEASKNFLLKLVANQALIAYVTDFKYDYMSICLCDTNGKEDVHINDLLIEECHAKFQPDNMTTEVLNDLQEDLTLEKGLDYAGIEAPTPLMEELTNNMEAMEMESGRRYIKFVRLNLMYDVHLVNYNNTAYLPGTEISAFFWDTNKLRAMLRAKKLIVPNQVVCQEDDPDLFEEFKHFQVKGLMEGEEVKPYTTIYELSSVPVILDGLKHPSLELKNSIKDLIEKFDAEDSYWRGDEPEISYDSESDAMTFDLSLEDLNLMLKAMQFRRHRLLQNMGTLSTFSETTVDEVNEVEIQINAIQEKIKSVSGKEQKKLKMTGESTSKATSHIVRADSDEFIQNCLDNFQVGGGDANHQNQYGAKFEEPRTPNINRVAPFMDAAMATTMTTSAATTGDSSHQATMAGAALPSTQGNFSFGNLGMPMTSQVGMGFPGLGLPLSTQAGNLPGAGVGMPGLSMLPLNQGLLTPQQQQQILAMASMLQAQGAMMPQATMPAMSTGRGAAPFLFPPMMNYPGMSNPMMPQMQPLGRGQPNTTPANPFNPGTKPTGK